MRKYLFILATIISFIIHAQVVSLAMTVTAAPTPANVNQTVGVNVNAFFAAAIGVTCNLVVNFGDSGTWTNLPTCTNASCIRNINHVYTTPGSYTITAQPLMGACAPLPTPPTTATTNITVLCPALSFTSPSILPQATESTSYSYQVQASGGMTPYSYTVISGALPTGLSMNAAGLISGTPSAAGTYNFTIRVTDSCFSGSQTAQRSFTITVNPAPCPPLNITSPSILMPGTVAQPYTHQVQTSGGVPFITFDLTSGVLPPGLNMTPSGLISGTPTTAGSYNFNVTAEDGCGSGSQVEQKIFTININPADCPVLNITSPSVLASGTAAQPYTYQILTSGGVPPRTFALVSGLLPPGLYINAAGMLSGIPTAAGTYNFAISVSDSCASGTQQVQGNFSIVINPEPIGPIQVIVIPPALRITRNSAWTQNVLYSFTGSSSAPTITLDSNKGIFTADSTVIGENIIPLNVTINNGTGKVTEVLNIPVAISERAEELGTSRIMYSRIFSNAFIQVTAQMEITVTTGATSDFKITRLQLYFENKRAEITVQRNQPNLKVNADIKFSGLGLLTGYWEVDGRILQYVNQHLVYGKSITLTSPEVPALPTFSPGTHIVRFVITQFLGDTFIPEAIYFVKAEESSEVLTIRLVMPEDDGQIGYEPFTFGWKKEPWANTFHIEFFGEDTEKGIFSAFTRKSTYLLPPAILNSVFAADTTYQWQVKGYDAEGNIISESTMYSFTFSE